MSAARNTISPSTRGQNQTAPRADRQTVTFGEIAFNSVAKKKPTPDDVSHYIGLEHLDPENFEVTRWGSDVAPVGEKLLMKKGDLLFGKRRAYQRKVAIAPFDGIFSAHGMVLRPNEKVIDKDFFPFFMASDAFLSEAIRISVGGLSPTINWKDLKVLQFSLPPLAEQKKLASALWAMERVKLAYKKLLAETDRLVEARFVEMFGDPVKNDKGWPISSLDDAATITTGNTPPRADEENFGNYIEWVKTNNIIHRCGITKPDEGLSEKGFALCRYVDAGSILMTCIAVSLNTIGNMAVADRRVAFNQQINAITPKNAEATYLLFALSAQRNQLHGKTQKSLKCLLNKSSLASVKIPLPPLSLQREFAAFVGRAEKAKESLKGALKALTAAQKSAFAEATADKPKMNAAFRG